MERFPRGTLPPTARSSITGKAVEPATGPAKGPAVKPTPPAPHAAPAAPVKPAPPAPQAAPAAPVKPAPPAPQAAPAAPVKPAPAPPGQPQPVRGISPRETCDLASTCPTCGTLMQPEHAHYRCMTCGYRDSCCF